MDTTNKTVFVKYDKDTPIGRTRVIKNVAYIEFNHTTGMAIICLMDGKFIHDIPIALIACIN